MMQHMLLHDLCVLCVPGCNCLFGVKAQNIQQAWYRAQDDVAKRLKDRSARLLNWLRHGRRLYQATECKQVPPSSRPSLPARCLEDLLELYRPHAAACYEHVAHTKRDACKVDAWQQCSPHLARMVHVHPETGHRTVPVAHRGNSAAARLLSRVSVALPESRATAPSTVLAPLGLPLRLTPALDVRHGDSDMGPLLASLQTSMRGRPCSSGPDLIVAGYEWLKGLENGLRLPQTDAHVALQHCPPVATKGTTKGEGGKETGHVEAAPDIVAHLVRAVHITQADKQAHCITSATTDGPQPLAEEMDLLHLNWNRPDNPTIVAARTLQGCPQGSPQATGAASGLPSPAADNLVVTGTRLPTRCTEAHCAAISQDCAAARISGVAKSQASVESHGLLGGMEGSRGRASISAPHPTVRIWRGRGENSRGSGAAPPAPKRLPCAGGGVPLRYPSVGAASGSLIATDWLASNGTESARAGAPVDRSKATKQAPMAENRGTQGHVMLDFTSTALRAQVADRLLVRLLPPLD
jgi:hypothetical protein